MKQLIFILSTVFIVTSISSCTKQQIQNQCTNQLCQKTFRFESLSQNNGPFLPVTEVKTYTFTNKQFSNQPNTYELIANNLFNNYTETYDWKLISDSANTATVSIRNGDDIPTITILDSVNALFDENLPYPAQKVYKLTILP